MGSPKLVSGRRARRPLPISAADSGTRVDKAPGEDEELPGVDPREWIQSLTKGDKYEAARGHGTSRIANHNFEHKLDSPLLIRARGRTIELPKGATVTVFRSLQEDMTKWPKRSDRALALIIVRGIPGHPNYQITVYMDGRILKRAS